MRRLNSGEPVVNLRIATSETWKDKATGERKEKTEWHQVVIFNENLARVAEQYLRKGSKVYVEGQLQTRKWQDQSGQEKYSTEVVLQRFRGELTLLDGRGGGAAARARRRRPGVARRRVRPLLAHGEAPRHGGRAAAGAATTTSTTTSRSRSARGDGGRLLERGQGLLPRSPPGKGGGARCPRSWSTVFDERGERSARTASLVR